MIEVSAAVCYLGDSENDANFFRNSTKWSKIGVW